MSGNNKIEINMKNDPLVNQSLLRTFMNRFHGKELGLSGIQLTNNLFYNDRSTMDITMYILSTINNISITK